jgi:hypothetical protein
VGLEEKTGRNVVTGESLLLLKAHGVKEGKVEIKLAAIGRKKV